MGNQENVNFLEIIGQLYTQLTVLQKQNMQLMSTIKRQTEEHNQLIDLTNKISMPNYSGEKKE